MRETIIHLITHCTALPVEQVEAILETPPSRDKGDLALPCFQLAKAWRKSPAQIAAELAPQIEQSLPANSKVSAVTALGPYVNFFYDRQEVARHILPAHVHNQLEADHAIGTGQTVVVEYSSPNIAKHFKLYHIRSTMIGQALANTYAALGYTVEKINHIGDWGTQFGKLMAAYTRWGNEEDVKQEPLNELVKLYVQFHEEAKHDAGLEDEGRLWFKKLENRDAEASRLWQWFKEESMHEFEKIYELLGVKFDHQLGESFYIDQVDAVNEQLNAKGLLEESDGALVVFLDDEAPPCIIKKADGTSIYATRDIAAALYRYEKFMPAKMIYVVDQRQALHFKQVFAVLDKMGYAFAKDCHHISFGIMKINGEIGSTREGKGILLHEVLDAAIAKATQIIAAKNPDLPNKDDVAKAIGIGAIVFNDLKHHRTNEVDFNWDEAFNFEGKTGPYVQYTHARICSLLRRGQEEAHLDLEVNGALDEHVLARHPLFEDDLVWEILYALYHYPDVLKDTVSKDDPSRIAVFLLEICQLFNRFYARERIFTASEDDQRAKLLLCRKVAQILRHGLQLLTIQAPEQI